MVLERAAAEARAGRGGVVLMRAGAGTGKTALLDAWAGVQQPGEIRVVSASGAELEQGFAFAVLRQLVEPLLARAGDEGRARLLSGPAQLASHALSVEGTGELSPEASLGLLHSLYWLTVHAADEGPLALVVDDVHWADRPSARWLEYLARRLRGLPCCWCWRGGRTTVPGPGRCWNGSPHSPTVGGSTCPGWTSTV